MSNENWQYDVFISYAREDIEVAAQLFSRLENCGIRAWLDTEALLPGQSWKKEITKAIRNSRACIALLSTHSASKRGYIQKEVSLALDVLGTRPQSEIFLVPARIDDCRPSDDRLLDIQWVDLFPSFGKGLARILDSLRLIGLEPREPFASPTRLQSSEVTALSGGTTSGVRSASGRTRNVEMTVPLKFGWHLGGCEHQSVTVEPRPDSTFGEAVRIALPAGAYMDYTIPRGSQASRRVEFAAELRLVYAKVKVRNRDSRAERPVWIAFLPGSEAPSPFGDGRDEWNYPVQPETHQSGWSLYEVEIADATRDTFGRDGWSFLAIVGFRLRLDNTFAYLRVST